MESRCLLHLENALGNSNQFPMKECLWRVWVSRAFGPTLSPGGPGGPAGPISPVEPLFPSSPLGPGGPGCPTAPYLIKKKKKEIQENKICLYIQLEKSNNLKKVEVLLFGLKQ